MIEPIRRSILVRCDPARAFEVFTDGMGDWWPFEIHSRATDEETGTPAREVIFDHEPGGGIWEVDADGERSSWGQVLAWEPPSRLVMAWKPHDRPTEPTEVEVTFTPVEGGTHVVLEHRGWERLGDLGPEGRDSYANGWPLVFDQRFAAAADAAAA